MFCAAHRVVAAEASECPEEAQEKLRGQLQGLGISGEGDPCRWDGIECWNCYPWRIDSSEATGDLSSVKEMTDLRALNLLGSQITGKLSELAKLKDLRQLRLSNTQVSGNIEELSKLKKLWHLDLSQTQVVGNVLGLCNVTELEELFLAQSRVHGKIKVISSMPALQKADLSGTAVSGNLGDLPWWGCCKKLRELHLGVPASIGTAVFFYVFVGKCGCTI